MTERSQFLLAAAMVVLVAAAFRLPMLSVRPMHTDEAVNGIKFGRLLEQGYYRYDAVEYHGPVLHYFALVPAWLRSAGSIDEVNEATLRVLPAVFGVLLVLLFLSFRSALGGVATILAAIFASISPALVFYSRYFIHETLLVLFTWLLIGCMRQYGRCRRWVWAVGSGLCLGLMHATKETFVLAIASMVVAAAAEALYGPKVRLSDWIRGANRRHILYGFLAAAIVSAAFFSSFLSYPKGIAESILAYGNYIDKAGADSYHSHPWYYYLKMLIYYRLERGPVFTEAIVLILGLLGFAAAMGKKASCGADHRFVRFIGFYTISLTVLYCAIPYKTPWCMVSFLSGFILLAGFGAAILLRWCSTHRMGLVMSAIIGAAVLSSGRQSYLGNYRHYAEYVNPYVYAHTTTDVFDIVSSIEAIASRTDRGRDLYIEADCTGHDYWPLPWYLRSFKTTGWYGKVDDHTPKPDIIIASADLKDAVLHKLYEVPAPGQRDMYMPLFDTGTKSLMPGFELMGLVSKPLYDEAARTLR